MSEERKRVYFHMRADNRAGLAAGYYTALADVTARSDGLVDLELDATTLAAWKCEVVDCPTCPKVKP